MGMGKHQTQDINEIVGKDTSLSCRICSEVTRHIIQMLFIKISQKQPPNKLHQRSLPFLCTTPTKNCAIFLRSDFMLSTIP